MPAFLGIEVVLLRAMNGLKIDMISRITARYWQMKSMKCKKIFVSCGMQLKILS